MRYVAWMWAALKVAVERQGSLWHAWKGSLTVGRLTAWDAVLHTEAFSCMSCLWQHGWECSQYWGVLMAIITVCWAWMMHCKSKFYLLKWKCSRRPPLEWSSFTFPSYGLLIPPHHFYYWPWAKLRVLWNYFDALAGNEEFGCLGFFLIILFKLIWDTKQAQGHQGSSLKHMKRHQLCAKKAKQLMSPSWYEHNSDTTFFHTVCQYGDDDSRSSLTGRRRPPLKWSSPRQIFTWNWLLFL